MRKCLLFSVFVMGFGNVAEPLWAESAKQAIAALRSARGERAAGAIVFMRGRHGQHQPSEWEIIANGGGAGYQRILVGNQRVLAEGAANRSVHGVPLSLGTLRVDSTQAFLSADAAARRARVGFDSLDYELRSLGNSRKPMWVVVLRDVRRSEVGLLEIHGESGQILRSRWRQSPEGAGIAQPQATHRPDPTPERIYEDPNMPRIDRAKYEEERDPRRVEKNRLAYANLWERSTSGLGYAGERVKNGVVGIGDSFRDIVKGRATFRSTGKSRYTSRRKVRAGSRR